MADSLLTTEQILDILSPGKPATVEVLGGIIRQLAERLGANESRLRKLGKITFDLKESLEAPEEVVGEPPAGAAPAAEGTASSTEGATTSESTEAVAVSDPFSAADLPSPEAQAIAKLPPEAQAAILEQAVAEHEAAQQGAVSAEDQALLDLAAASSKPASGKKRK